MPLAQAARRRSRAGTCPRTRPAAWLTAAASPPRRPAPDPDHPTAAFAPDGTLIALVTEESGEARPLVVFAGG